MTGQLIEALRLIIALQLIVALTPWSLSWNTAKNEDKPVSVPHILTSYVHRACQRVKLLADEIETSFLEKFTQRQELVPHCKKAPCL
jgi:hypothetical protein